GEKDARAEADGLRLCACDRGGVAAVGVFGQGLRASGAGHCVDGRLACHHPHAIQPRRRKRHEDVLEHRGRERGALCRAERGHQPLLGIDEILDGHRRDDHEACSNTTRASAISRAASGIITSVGTALTPTALRASAHPASSRATSSVDSHGAYARAIPPGETGRLRARINAAAGPLTAAPATIGLTPITRPRVEASASAMPGTATIGPIDVTGFDGHTTTTSASRIASSTPGAGRARAAPS